MRRAALSDFPDVSLRELQVAPAPHRIFSHDDGRCSWQPAPGMRASCHGFKRLTGRRVTARDSRWSVERCVGMRNTAVRHSGIPSRRDRLECHVPESAHDRAMCYWCTRPKRQGTRAGSGSYGLITSTPMRTTFAVPWFSAQCSTSRDSVMKPPGPTVFA